MFLENNYDISHADLGTISDLDSFYQGNTITPYEDKWAISVVWIKKVGEPNFHQMLLGSRGRHAFFDRDTKVSWVAKPNGVETYHFKPKRFQHILGKSNNKLSYRALNINLRYSLLFIGSEIIIYDKQLRSQVELSKQIKEAQGLPHGFNEESSSDYIWGLNRGEIISVRKSDLFISKFLLSRKDGSIRSFFKKGNQLWIGQNKGLKCYDLTKEEVLEFDNYNEFSMFPSSKIHFFKEIDEEHLWICTNTGLYLCSKEKGLIARYGNTEKDEYHLPAKEFFHISEAKDGGYWLASMNGLIRWKNPLFTNGQIYQTQIPQIQHFISPNHLITNEILAVYEDDFGFVWMPTPHGLIQFEIETSLSKTYSKLDGLSNPGLQEYAHAQGEDGTLYIGSYEGFNIFHPKDFKDVKFDANVPLVITDFEQYEDQSQRIEYRLEQLLKYSKIILKPGDKFFNIRVALSDYRAAEQHRFAYKIEGYQEEWIEGRSNLIRISGLPYGNFDLRIKGRLANGLYSTSELNIPIQVLKPFYFQWWFILFCLAAIILASIWWYTRRTSILLKKQAELELIVQHSTEAIRDKNKKLEHQTRELQRLDKVKTRFFANVSHELRTPLTMMLGPLGTMITSKKLDPKNEKLTILVKQNTQHLLKLVNEILDLTKLEASKMELQEKNVMLYEVMQRLLGAFESYAQRQNIQFEFHCEIDKYLQIRLDAAKFEKVLNNLLSNAFKFTPKGQKITVRIKDLATHIQLEVEDTGRGIAPTDLPRIFERFYQSTQIDALTEGGTGIGLAICMEFAKLMNANLSVESTLGEGSTFSFRFPKKEVMGIIEKKRIIIPEKEISPEEDEELLIAGKHF